MKLIDLDTNDLAAPKALYAAVGWQSYLRDEAAFARQFTNSLACVGAYRSGELIGLARAVGDGEHILYVQDILVHPSHRRQGVGRALLKELLDVRYPRVRQKVLLTDSDDAVAHAFYEALGFKHAVDRKVTAFVRFDR